MRQSGIRQILDILLKPRWHNRFSFNILHKIVIILKMVLEVIVRKRIICRRKSVYGWSEAAGRIVVIKIIPLKTSCREIVIGRKVRMNV